MNALHSETRWCDDPANLAELWRYLEETGETLPDPAYFMEKGHKWQAEWDRRQETVDAEATSLATTPLYVAVDGVHYFITDHATRRYNERVRPELDHTQAGAALVELLEAPGVTLCNAPQVDELRSGEIRFPVHNRTITTCIAPGRVHATPRIRHQDEAA